MPLPKRALPPFVTGLFLTILASLNRHEIAASPRVPETPGQIGQAWSDVNRTPDTTLAQPDTSSHWRRPQGSRLESLLNRPEDGSWVELGARRRFGHSAIFDPVRQRMVLFGGLAGPGVPRAEVLALSLADSAAEWAVLPTAGPTPNAREGHTAIYDPARDRMVVFGGELGDGSYSKELWELSFTTEPATWRLLQATGEGPAGRTGHSAVFDPDRDRMILFGGWNGTYHNDLWSLSLEDPPVWDELHPLGTPPAARMNHAAVYACNNMLVFGGFAGDYDDRPPHGGFHSRHDLWALVLSGEPSWFGGSIYGDGGPYEIEGHTMVFDELRQGILICGGFARSSPGSGPFNDLWYLGCDGSGIRRIGSSSGSTPERSEHVAIYDSQHHRMVIHGGCGLVYPLGDTWAFTLNSARTEGVWRSIAAAPDVPDSPGSATAYDPNHHRMYVFGGFSTNDVWLVTQGDYVHWTPIQAGGPGPQPRISHSMIYDPVRNRLVVFGGDVFRWTSPFGGGQFQVDELWSLNLGPNPAWTQIIPSGNSPSRRRNHSAVYDPAGDRMIIFGGDNDSTVFNDVWALSLDDPTHWSRLTPAGQAPVARTDHTATYDPVDRCMLVFGGQTGVDWPPGLGDTWSLSLEGDPAWTRLDLAGTSPPPRLRHTAIYDPVQHRVVVAGGQDAYGRNDVWALELDRAPLWHALEPSGGPTPSWIDHLAHFDPDRDEMALIGHPYVWKLAWGEPRTPVGIDVQPGHAEDVQPHRWVPVAVLGSAAFDARAIDPRSLSFSGARVSAHGNGKPRTHFADVNHDRFDDLVALFSTRELSLEPDARALRLDGITFSGRPFRGWSAFRPASRRRCSGPPAAELEAETVPFDLGVWTPNPSGGRPRFTVSLPTSAPARFVVMDVQGRSVFRREVEFPAGQHAVLFGESRLPPGLYFGRLSQLGRSVTRKFAVVQD